MIFDLLPGRHSALYSVSNMTSIRLRTLTGDPTLSRARERIPGESEAVQQPTETP